jgi:GT2 family glycosyltransferase
MTIEISVIVPTCNRSDLLARCLESLAPGKQTLNGELYEVIVTDDGTTAGAEQLISDTYPWAKLSPGPRRGPAANRNNGARKATGTFLAFIDDDCIADEHWLTELYRCMSSNEVQVIEGKTIIPDKVDSPFLHGVENTTGDLFLSCNLCIARSTFTELGGFDEDFLEAGGEDLELGWRIKSAGLPNMFLPSALVMHPLRPLSWKKLWWKTFLIRWILLYRLKTGQSLPLSENPIKVAMKVARDESLNMLRNSKRFFTRTPWKSSWRTAVFNQLWTWLTFPLVIPYMIWWELRFRKKLADRRSGDLTHALK